MGQFTCVHDRYPAKCWKNGRQEECQHNVRRVKWGSRTPSILRGHAWPGPPLSAPKNIIAKHSPGRNLRYTKTSTHLNLLPAPHSYADISSQFSSGGHLDKDKMVFFWQQLFTGRAASKTGMQNYLNTVHQNVFAFSKHKFQANILTWFQWWFMPSGKMGSGQRLFMFYHEHQKFARPANAFKTIIVFAKTSPSQ